MLYITKSYVSGRWVNCKVRVKPYLTLLKNMDKCNEVIWGYMLIFI